MFRFYFKAEYTRLLSIAHEYGMKVLMHSCGSNWAIVDDLIDCGVDCFQFDQPAIYDMPKLAAKFRERKASLWSPVDIQKILPTGDKAYIESEAECMCKLFDGFLICQELWRPEGHRRQARVGRVGLQGHLQVCRRVAGLDRIHRIGRMGNRS